MYHLCTHACRCELSIVLGVVSGLHRVWFVLSWEGGREREGVLMLSWSICVAVDEVGSRILAS